MVPMSRKGHVSAWRDSGTCCDGGWKGIRGKGSTFFPVKLQATPHWPQRSLHPCLPTQCTHQTTGANQLYGLSELVAYGHVVSSTQFFFRILARELELSWGRLTAAGCCWEPRLFWLARIWLPLGCPSCLVAIPQRTLGSHSVVVQACSCPSPPPHLRRSFYFLSLFAFRPILENKCKKYFKTFFCLDMDWDRAFESVILVVDNSPPIKITLITYNLIHEI